jgi:hypothetical protein
MIEAIAAERHARDREIILEAGAKEEIPKVLRTLIDRFESIARSARPQGAQDGDAMVDGGAAEPAHSQNRSQERGRAAQDAGRNCDACA